MPESPVDASNLPVPFPYLQFASLEIESRVRTFDTPDLPESASSCKYNIGYSSPLGRGVYRTSLAYVSKPRRGSTFFSPLKFQRKRENRDAVARARRHEIPYSTEYRELPMREKIFRTLEHREDSAQCYYRNLSES